MMSLRMVPFAAVALMLTACAVYDPYYPAYSAYPGYPTYYGPPAVIGPPVFGSIELGLGHFGRGGHHDHDHHGHWR